LIHRDGLSAVCEVKPFDKDPIGWMRDTGQGGWIDFGRFGTAAGVVANVANNPNPRARFPRAPP